MSQNVSNYVNETFKEYMTVFLKQIETSQMDLTEHLNQLEKKTFEMLSSHYSGVNQDYQSSKDILNNFVIMIYNEIRTTVEANFHVFKEQLKNLQNYIISQLNKNEITFESGFKEVSSRFEEIILSFSAGIKDFFAEFKKQKGVTTGLLLDKIKANIELNQTEAFSRIMEIIKTFSTELNKETTKINDVVKKRFDGSAKKFNENLAGFNQGAQKFFEGFLKEYQESASEIRERVKTHLSEIVQDQSELSQNFKTDFLKNIEDQKKELDEQLEKVLKNTEESYKEYEEELEKIDKTNQERIQEYNDVILKSENRLKTILDQKDIVIESDEDYKKEIRKFLQITNEIKKQNEEYQRELEKHHTKGTHNLQKDKTAIITSLKKVPEAVENKVNAIEKSLEKDIESLLKKYSSKIEKIKAVSGFFGSLDNQIKSFQSFIEGISGKLADLKEEYNQTMINGLNEVISLNSSSFSIVERAMEENMDRLSVEFQKYIIENIEDLKKIAVENVSEAPEITTLKIPIFDDILKNISNYFEQYFANFERNYQKIIQETYQTFFTSLDQLEKGIDEDISLFRNDLGKLYEDDQKKFQDLLEILKTSYDAQFSEFEERLDLDLVALTDANQELVGRIMIKSAKTGSEFFESSEQNSKKCEILVKEFLDQFSLRIQEFIQTFNQMAENTKQEIVKKISKHEDLVKFLKK